MEEHLYEGNINVDALMDWINILENYFDYEYDNEEKNVDFAITQFKGSATLWWDEVHAKRKEKKDKY